MRNKLVLDSQTTFHDAVMLFDLYGQGVLPVVDKDSKLLGLITDGDIRKAVLNNHLDLEHIIYKHPYSLHIDAPKNQY